MGLRCYARRRTRREEIRTVLRKFLSLLNEPRIEIKLNMIKLNLKLTRAPLRVGASELKRV